MKKTVLSVFAALLLLAIAAAAGDTSVLRPPKGYKLAIVEFADLECPDCARAEPLLEEAARTYKIPLVRYDFPLPKHNWSFDAHVNARWFDAKSKKLGEDYRGYIFKNQPQITRENLRSYTEQFAKDHKLALPLFVDPRGELAAKVRADFAIGQKVGIQHTPTIYIVSDSTRGTPFVEVVDRTNFFAMIDEMKRQVGGTVTTASTAKGSKKVQ
ncbi:MAG: thioredoxin domain-containing protein [Candidatus Koribacter versatilis]|uniref:Thioredoxin domain-containing protein n=1 Tax=Candidatus Korobacter versatilis TaxID=658062 RepID=A0A932A7L5_9BACT|nr:thioredoxin domain-containing protein [Candidatus Koribacter versatilis]